MEDVRRQEAIRELMAGLAAHEGAAASGLAVEEEEDAHLRRAGGRDVGERRGLRRQQRGDEEVARAEWDGEAEAGHQVEERRLVVLEVVGRPEDVQQLRVTRGW